MLSIKRLLYSLKKKYSQPIDFYKETNEQIDIRTGKKIIFRIKYHIKKGIFIHQKNNFRNPVIKSSQIEPNTGLLDITNAQLLIDGKDFPKEFKPELTDYVITNNERYEIKNIYRIDSEQSYYLILKEYKGSILHEIHDRNIIQKLTLINILKPKHEKLYTENTLHQLIFTDNLIINYIKYNRTIVDKISFNDLLFPIQLNNTNYISNKDMFLLSDILIKEIVRIRDVNHTINFIDEVIRDSVIYVNMSNFIDIDQNVTLT